MHRHGHAAAACLGLSAQRACGGTPRGTHCLLTPQPRTSANPTDCFQITLRDGTEVAAFEHGMTLSIVALRGSVPQQWALDFKMSIGAGARA